MIRDNFSSKQLAFLALTALFFSVIAAPVLAEDVAYLPTSPVTEPSPTLTEASIVPPRPTEVAIADPTPVESSTTEVDGSTYWMVSSRCSVQHIRERCRGPWGLMVQELHCDGTSIPSNIQTLSQQLVPGVPVCIFAHGSFVELPNQYVEAAALYSRIRGGSSAPVQMIFFTWPSDGPYTGCFPLDVAIRGRQADFNGFHLAYLISQIPEECPVCLIGHSHGCRLVLSTMHLAGGGTIEGHHFPYSMGATRRYRVILAAGAMDHNWINPGQRYGCALNRIECLLNLQNRHDLALGFYPLSRPFAHRAIARSGITRHDARKLGYNAAKVRDCDVTYLVGHNHYWPYYYRQPPIINAMIPYIYFY